VNRAAITAARYAVSSIGLAALAVSATRLLAQREVPEELVVESHLASNRAIVRDVTVVGSPDYEIVARGVQELEPLLQRCAWTTGRTTLYAHLANGVVTVVGGDASDCMTSVIEQLTVSSLDEMDVMIPIDVVAIPRESCR
jgi:hypothetical protein